MSGREYGSAAEIVLVVERARIGYRSMVDILRSGRRLPAEQIFGTLEAARKSAKELVKDVLVGRGDTLRPGDRCQKCGGALGIYSSRREGRRVVQYFCCRKCGHRPKNNKRTVPASTVRRRRRKAES